MSETNDLVTDDPEVEFILPDSTDPSRFTCEVCDEPLHYSGRGRHPKYCDEHKPSRSTTSTSTTKRAPKGVANIRSGMEQIYSMVGEGVGMLGKYVEDEALTIDGVLIRERSSVLAEQWADLAERDPDVRKALNNMTTGSSWGGVIITHVMLAGAIMINHKNNGTPRVKKPRQPRGRRSEGVQRPTPQPQPQSSQRVEPPPFIPVDEDEPYIPGVNAPDVLFVTEVPRAS